MKNGPKMPTVNNPNIVIWAYLLYSLTILAVFGPFLKGKPAGLTGKGLVGKGTYQIMSSFC